MATQDLTKTTWGEVRVALKQARLNRGWTQTDLAAATDYTKGRISQEERDSQDSIPFQYLDRVLPALGFDSISDLFSGKQRPASLLLALRSSATASLEEKHKKILEARVLRLLEPVRVHSALSRKLGLEDISLPSYNIPEPKSKEQATAQGQGVAEQFRRFLGVADRHPLFDLGRTLAQRGIAILGCDLPEGISGIVVGNGEEGYAIVYSNSEFRHRQRFTVAHELGHLLMDELPFIDLKDHPLKKRRADAFAAGLLLPPAWVDRVARNLGLGSPDSPSRPWRSLLGQLSEASGASLSACAVELKIQGYITDAEQQMVIDEDVQFEQTGQLDSNLDHLLLGKTMAAVETHKITPRRGLEILDKVWRKSTARETGYKKAEIEPMLRSLIPRL